MNDLSPETNQGSRNKDQIRSDKSTDKSAGRLKRVARNALLAVLALSPSIINDTNISVLDIKDPTPAAASTPQLPTETPTLTPTPHGSEKKENKELIPYSPSITIVDAAPSVPTEGLIQKEYISNDDMVKSMLGDKYVTKEQLIQEFGENYEKKWDEIVSKYPQVLTQRLVDIYFGHGEKVTRVMENTLARSGFQSTGVNILALQEIFDEGSVRLIKNAPGNPGVSLNFDPKRIIDLLKNDPNRVINGSFQVGNVELFQKAKVRTEVIPKYDQNDPQFSTSGIEDQYGTFYPGAVTNKNENGRIVFYDSEGKEVKPTSLSMDDYVEEVNKRRLENSETIEHKTTELITEGAYTKEKAMENLPKLFQICDAYPDRFFVFALGNNGEDIREAMEAFKDKSPNNLLIVAEWVKAPAYDYEGPAMVLDNEGKLVHGPVVGADIYVYNKGSNNPDGSSFSAPEISTEIEILLKKGLSFEQAKAKIFASNDIHSLELADGTKYIARVFNPLSLREN